MTRFAKTTRTAVAAAIAAAAVLTAVAVPAQAEYKRAPKQTTIKRAPKVSMQALKHLRVLKCLKTSGDVVAQPLVINTTGQILPIGRKIYWRANLANGAIYNGTHTLTTPLYAGQGRRIPATLHWRFTCTATVFV